MTTPASNNRFKGVTFQDQATPATPAAGDGRLFLDTADGLLKWIDDAGTVTEVALGSGAGFADPMTTRGDIIVRNASNVTARLAKGAADTFLHSDGTDVGYAAVTDAMLSTSDITTNNASTTKHGFAPKYPNDATKYLDGTGAYTVPAGSGGALVLLEQHTASTSASLDFTTFISSTYDEYLFELSNLDVATDNIAFNMFVGTGGGPTYDTATTNYGFSAFRQVFNGSGNAGAATNAGWALTGGDTMDNGASSGICGTIRLFNPASASLNKRMLGQVSYVLNSNSGYLNCIFSGSYHSATALTAIQFKPASGNIDAGTVRVYGVAK